MFSTHDLAREQVRSRQAEAERQSLANAVRAANRARSRARRATLRVTRAEAELRSLPL
jgi:hypothetical protein